MLVELTDKQREVILDHIMIPGYQNKEDAEFNAEIGRALGFNVVALHPDTDDGDYEVGASS